jgi:hypothetical protein
MIKRKSKHELRSVIKLLKRSGFEIKVGRKSIRSQYYSGVGKDLKDTQENRE